MLHNPCMFWSLSGYLLLAERLWEGGPEFTQGWNFGPNDEEAENDHGSPSMNKQVEEGGRWEPDLAWHPHEGPEIGSFQGQKDPRLVA